MSFSSDTKIALSSEIPARKCCKKAYLMGSLAFSGIFTREKIRYITEIGAASENVVTLLDELYGIRSEVVTTEKHGGKERVISCKVTVSDKNEISKMSPDFKKNSVSLYRVNKNIFDEGCGRCASMFLRGAFIASGTVSRPDSSFHLEISTPYKNLASDTAELIKENGIIPRTTMRGSNYVIYLKKCDDIADFLAYIGATSASFDYINESILRESRGLANRAVNCDTANIKKTVAAASGVSAAIDYLIKNSLLEKLPEEIRKTAVLRYENPQASLAELADMSTPKLTKSGVSHRLKRITDLYEKYKRGKTD